MQPSDLLTLRDAGRRIEEQWIWRGLSLDLGAGDRIGVAGPSGSGKTLLLRALAGLDRLDEGRLVFDGTPLDDWDLPRYRARVVYLTQRPALTAASVEANLRLVFAFGVHEDRHYDPEQIQQWLAVLERDASFLDRSTTVLSGGEQQMVAFLRALQIEPDVLLLDEPTASIDEANTRRIETLVTAWLEERAGRAVLWTSHQPEQLRRVTDRHLDLSR